MCNHVVPVFVSNYRQILHGFVHFLKKKHLSNHGRYDSIEKITKNTSADSDGGALHQVPEEARDAGGS